MLSSLESSPKSSPKSSPQSSPESSPEPSQESRVQVLYLGSQLLISLATLCNYQYFFIFPTSIMLLALMVRIPQINYYCCDLWEKGPLPIMEVSIDTKHLHCCHSHAEYFNFLFCVICMQDGSGWGGNSSCT